MKSLEESVVYAMDGSDVELFPFIPYILQDFWEIGADPKIIVKLIAKYTNSQKNLKVLDMGSGKGAVSINIAAKLGFECLGIDAIPDFIVIARQKASEFHVSHLCHFEVGDIRKKVNKLGCFDIIVLGSIGPVLGNWYKTLTILSPLLKDDGMIIIDDGYIEDGSDFTYPQVQKKQEIIDQIKCAKMQLVEEVRFNVPGLGHETYAAEYADVM